MKPTNARPERWPQLRLVSPAVLMFITITGLATALRLVGTKVGLKPIVMPTAQVLPYEESPWPVDERLLSPAPHPLFKEPSFMAWLKTLSRPEQYRIRHLLGEENETEQRERNRRIRAYYFLKDALEPLEISEGISVGQVPPMKVGVPQRISISIKPELLKRLGSIRSDDLDVSVIPLFRVYLRAEKGDMVHLEHLVGDTSRQEGESRWIWLATPIESGLIKWNVSAYVTLRQVGELDKDSSEKWLGVLSWATPVKDNYPLRVRLFVSEYWQWIISSIAVPLWLWLRSVRKRSTEEKRTRIVLP